MNLDRHFPSKVYKPVKGVYRHVQFRDPPDAQPGEDKSRSVARAARIPEEKFYPLFAAWLTNDFEEVTVAIPLGGNAFRDRWGTPDVLGKNESRRSDVIKGPTSIVSAEIKVDTASLLIGFGQACAHMLFSHKSYLVVPADASAEELDRLIALCQMFGLGLVVFDACSLARPAFRLLLIFPKITTTDWLLVRCMDTCWVSGTAHDIKAVGRGGSQAGACRANVAGWQDARAGSARGGGGAADRVHLEVGAR